MHSGPSYRAVPTPLEWVDELLDYFATAQAIAPGRPDVATWVEGGQGHFAALQTIDGRPWVVLGSLAVSESGIVKISHLAVAGWEHDDEVTGRVLRAIRPAELRDLALSDFAWRGSEPVVHLGTGTERAPLDLFPASEAPTRARLLAGKNTHKRYTQRPEKHYEDVARLYIQIFQRHKGHNLLYQLCDELGVPHSTAHDWVKRARKLGFLAPGRRGQASASPGPRLPPDNTQPNDEH